MSTLSYPVRPSSRFKPYDPEDSFLRTGYKPTPTNPHGYHWAGDIICPVGSIIQLPEKARQTAKGHDELAGYWMEWQILVGPFKGHAMRFFHMDRESAFSVGTVKNRKYAVGRSGCTGNCTGPHVHFEIAEHVWHDSRDPRYNPKPYMHDAFVAKDW